MIKSPHESRPCFQNLKCENYPLHQLVKVLKCFINSFNIQGHIKPGHDAVKWPQTSWDAKWMNAKSVKQLAIQIMMPIMVCSTLSVNVKCINHMKPKLYLYNRKHWRVKWYSMPGYYAMSTLHQLYNVHNIIYK